MATTALVIGIISVVGTVTCVGGVILGIIAIVLGALGRKRAKELQGTGAGMATAGIITGALGLIIGGAFLTLVIMSAASDSPRRSHEVNIEQPDGVCNYDHYVQDPDC